MDDTWKALKAFTQARIGLKRSGASTGTADLLAFQEAHAFAREAVWRPWDANALAAKIPGAVVIPSLAKDRAEFLKRPDLGRALAPGAVVPKTKELLFIVSDGLSSTAVDTQFLPLWEELRSRPGFDNEAPVIVSPFGRVALSDPLGQRAGARLCVMFIGERPGLSAADSLGVYLTYDPRPGRVDSERNCISNIRTPGGLSSQLAADVLLYLINESLRRKLSGVSLKIENSGDQLLIGK